MEAKAQLSKGKDGTLSALGMAIEAMNLAKEISSITPAKAVFGSVSTLLTMVKVCFSSPTTGSLMFTHGQDSMTNKLDYVELCLACADVCRALDRGMNEKRVNELSRSVYEAIEQLTT